MNNYDIAIAGGAMAGATLALALHQKSNGKLRIAVVEPCTLDTKGHPGFDARSIALSLGTQQILERFSLWDDIAPVSTAIKRIHVSDKGHFGVTELDSQEQHVAALGYVVELADIGRIYHNKLSQLDNIDFYCPDSVCDIIQSNDLNDVHLSSGEIIQCRLLVAADGADSACCRLLNIKNQQHDFAQTAVIANIKTEQAHRGRAFERFTPDGPVALLPMSDNRMSLVWCMSSINAVQVAKHSDDECIDKLQELVGWRLGKIVQIGKRGVYPLTLKSTESVITHRFACVGNASQLLHPIAGQGFNLGIRDIASLVDTIDLTQGLGDYASLLNYSQRRIKDREKTIALTSGLVTLFSNDECSLSIGRNIGLLAMDNVPLIKSPLLKRTMGLVER